jgi:hypothetical protein
MRADRRPSGVAMLPKSLGVALTFRGVVFIETFFDCVLIFPSLGWTDNQDKPMTAIKPIKAI